MRYFIILFNFIGNCRNVNNYHFAIDWLLMGDVENIVALNILYFFIPVGGCAVLLQLHFSGRSESCSSSLCISDEQPICLSF